MPQFSRFAELFLSSHLFNNMSHKTLQDRQIRLQNLDIINEHVKKLPAIAGIVGVNRPEAQSDIDLINGSSAELGGNGGQSRRFRSTRGTADSLKCENGASALETSVATARYSINNHILAMLDPMTVKLATNKSLLLRSMFALFVVIFFAGMR